MSREFDMLCRERMYTEEELQNGFPPYRLDFSEFLPSNELDRQPPAPPFERIDHVETDTDIYVTLMQFALFG